MDFYPWIWLNFIVANLTFYTTQFVVVAISLLIALTSIWSLVLTLIQEYVTALQLSGNALVYVLALTIQQHINRQNYLTLIYLSIFFKHETKFFNSKYTNLKYEIFNIKFSKMYIVFSLIYTFLTFLIPYWYFFWFLELQLTARRRSTRLKLQLLLRKNKISANLLGL